MELVRTLSPALLTERWLREVGVDVGLQFESLTRIDHFRCAQTGLEWYVPAEAAGGSTFYRQLERFDWYYMPDKWEFRTALAEISPGHQVLEVGSGVGHFLAAAHEKGIFPTGVELNSSAAKLARALGFVVHEEDIGSLAHRLGPTFDAVCCFQTLEHVPNPGEFLDGMLGTLRTGGKLILSVPNAAVLRVVDPDYQNLLDQPPHHLSHWNEQVFLALEDWFPLKVSAARREPLQSYHTRWLVTAFLRRPFGRRFGRLAFNRYTLAPLLWVLRRGPRRLFPGHSLLVICVKTEQA